MLASTTTVFTVLVALTAASPVVPRAGGPAIKPIPSSCTITDPKPAEANFLPKGVEPLYAAYFPSPSTNTTQMAEQCLQQCYGYGDSTQCHAAFWAENVEVPQGSRGTGKMTTCQLFSRPLTAQDFEPAMDGEATDAYARNLAC